MTTPQPPQPQSADPAATIRSLNAIIKALVTKYGEPQATVPPSIITTLTQSQVAQAYSLALTIAPMPPDPNPEPWLLLTVEGI